MDIYSNSSQSWLKVMAEVLQIKSNYANTIDNQNIYTWFSFGSNSSGLLLLNNEFQDVHKPTVIKEFPNFLNTYCMYFFFYKIRSIQFF